MAHRHSEKISISTYIISGLNPVCTVHKFFIKFTFFSSLFLHAMILANYHWKLVSRANLHCINFKTVKVSQLWKFWQLLNPALLKIAERVLGIFLLLFCHSNFSLHLSPSLLSPYISLSVTLSPPLSPLELRFSSLTHIGQLAPVNAHPREARERSATQEGGRGQTWIDGITWSDTNFLFSGFVVLLICSPSDLKFPLRSPVMSFLRYVQYWEIITGTRLGEGCSNNCSGGQDQCVANFYACIILK